MNILYAILIYPLEFIYNTVYALCYSIFGNYGIGLFALSFLSALGYIPLGRVAVKAQNNERHIKNILDPQIKKINTQENQGSKRHKRITALYKRYRYHPILVLRSALGVILQLPFLLGAYYMIRHYTGLEGQSFAFIKDLSKPDSLLFGFNFLPLLMTIINIITTFLTPQLEKKDKLQAIIIALLFLVLLYTAPSALLIFWTTNNCIFFLQTLFLRKNAKITVFLRTENNARKPISLSQSFLFNEKIQHNIYTYFKPFIISLGITFFYFIINLWWGLKHLGQNSQISGAKFFKMAPEIFFALLALSTYFTLLFLQLNKKKLTLKFFITQTLIWIPTLGFFVYLFFSKIIFTINLVNLLFYSLVILTILIAVFLYINKNIIQYKLNIILNNKEKLIYFLSSYILLTEIFFVNTTQLIKSDINFFSQQFISILSSVFLWYVITMCILALIWTIKNSIYRKILATTMLAITIALTLFNFISSNEYGSLDFPIFANPEFFDTTQILKDLLAIFLSCIIFFILIGKHKKIIPILTIWAITFTTTPIINIISTYNAQNKNQSVISDNKTQKFYAFSKTEPNIIFFFWDMFTGGHIPILLERNPDLAKKLDGFVWYPDTLAPSQNTLISSPTMYGGVEFTPEKINKKNGNLIEKYNESLLVLPLTFAKQEYNVAINTMPYLDEQYFYEHTKQYGDSILLYEPPSKNSNWYLTAKRQLVNNTTSHYDKIVLQVSFFKSMPNILRNFIYNNAQWLTNIKYTNLSVLDEIAKLKMFNENATFSSPKPTIKLYYSMLSHFTWHLKEKELTLVNDPYPKTQGQIELINGLIPEHLYTEEHMLYMLIDLINLLKKENVYDNTRIIIVSDHDEADSPMIPFTPKAGRISFSHGRPHAILFFKDFNTKGNLQIRNNLMTSNDAFYLLQKDITLTEKDFPDNSIRYHRTGGWQFSEHHKEKYDYKTFTITGSMFEKKNWSIAEETAK